MSDRPERGVLPRLAVGLVGLALPLLAAGAAQGALAGATPAQFTGGTPNLRSATIDSTYSNVVEVCFDRTINGIFTFSGFELVGYRAGNTLPASSASIDQNNPDCAVVFFPSTTADENQYTILEVAAGTVYGNSTSNPNLADSVGLTGSTSHSGITGVTTEPNLVGVLVPDSTHLATDSLTFVFDKSTHVEKVGYDYFDFETAAGSLCEGQSLLAGQDTTAITIGFAPTTCFAAGTGTVGQAVRAGVEPGAVYADQDPIPPAPYSAPSAWTALPNCASPCATSRPDLTAAALGSNKDQIVFTFDKNVIVNPTFTHDFWAELTDGQLVASTGATLTAPNQITATYSGNLSNKSEFAVEAWVDFGVAFASDNLTSTGESLPGTANIGDNAGALSAGFTSAPDSFGVTINHTTGQVIVMLDDRISSLNPAAVRLYTAQGLPVPIAPTSEAYNSSAGSGPEAVTLQYSPSGITNVTALQMLQGAFTGPCPAGGTCATPFSSVLADSQSVPQIDDPPNDAAILKAYKATHHRHLRLQRHQQHHM